MILFAIGKHQAIEMFLPSSAHVPESLFVTPRTQARALSVWIVIFTRRSSFSPDHDLQLAVHTLWHVGFGVCVAISCCRA